MPNLTANASTINVYGTDNFNLATLNNGSALNVTYGTFNATNLSMDSGSISINADAGWSTLTVAGGMALSQANISYGIFSTLLGGNMTIDGCVEIALMFPSLVLGNVVVNGDLSIDDTTIETPITVSSFSVSMQSLTNNGYIDVFNAFGFGGFGEFTPTKPHDCYRPVAEFNVDTITNNSGHEIDFGGPTAISAGTVWNVGTIYIGYGAGDTTTFSADIFVNTAQRSLKKVVRVRQIPWTTMGCC